MFHQRRSSYFISVTVLAVSIVATLAECPYKLCECKGDEISCIGPGYEKLPVINDTGNEFTRMTVVSETLQEIPDHSLPSNLLEMRFWSTPMTNISSHAFDQIGNTLHHLDLSETTFTRLPDAFSALKALKHLRMEYTVILDWNDDALQQMASTVDSLQLIQVGLSEWPKWMRHFTSLETLQINHQPIAPFPDDAFEGFKDTLNLMAFRNVNMTEIPPAFSKLSRIETLYLYNNTITELKNLPCSTRLKELSVGESRLVSSDTFVQGLLPHAKTLEFLDLIANNLTDFPDFSALSALEILDLEENNLTDPVKPSLPLSLTNLYLRKNKLTKIPSSVSKMNRLKTLLIAYNDITEIKDTDISSSLSRMDAKSNKITSLPKNSFPENSSLTQLDLSSNPIAQISDQAFEPLSQLTKMVLKDTKLTRLPMALSSLKKVYTVYLEHNPDLVCTCQEAGLLTWYRSIPHLGVLGDCGNMTIDYFFEHVAPNCSI